jgi:hypothetical protein
MKTLKEKKNKKDSNWSLFTETLSDFELLRLKGGDDPLPPPPPPQPK